MSGPQPRLRSASCHPTDPRAGAVGDAAGEGGHVSDAGLEARELRGARGEPRAQRRGEPRGARAGQATAGADRRDRAAAAVAIAVISGEDDIGVFFEPLFTKSI